jgi:hypothetical protein
VVTLPLAVACSAAPSAPEAEETSSAAVTNSTSTCPPAQNVIIITPLSGAIAKACPAINGRGGQWQATTDFKTRTCYAKDNSGNTSAMCSYTWQSTSGATPDTNALVALPNTYVAADTGGDVAGCAQASFLPVGAIENLANVSCPVPAGGGGPSGPVQCDTCGYPGFPGVIGPQLWLPSSNPYNTWVVGVNNYYTGATSYQAITLSASQMHTSATVDSSMRFPFTVVTLPKPPAGFQYDGSALGYGYNQH